LLGKSWRGRAGHYAAGVDTSGSGPSAATAAQHRATLGPRRSSDECGGRCAVSRRSLTRA